MRLTALLLCLACLAACGVVSAQTSDIPRDHWAYDAVNELAGKGLVLGYPDGKFLGDRTLTRYEMATIVKRIVDRIDSIPAPAQSSTPEPAAPAVEASAPSTPSVSPEELAEVKRLIEEFKTELTVIGTDLSVVTKRLDDVEAATESVKELVTEPEGAIQSTIGDVKKLKKIAVSGYLQSRYESYSDAVDEDNKAAVNSFNVRRARVKVTAKPTNSVTGVMQFDIASNKTSVKEAFMEYNAQGDTRLSPTFAIGQMNWPFGYEVVYSSSRRETPEQALWARRFFPGEYDRGARVSYNLSPNLLAQVGVFDGTGIDNVTSYKVVDASGKTQKVQSTVSRDYNNHKDIVANLQYDGGSWEIGASGYLGKGVWDADRAAMNNVDKIRYGVDFRYFLENVTLKAEYCRAKGLDEGGSAFDQSKWLDGYYAQLNVNVSKIDTLVARYESLSLDPKALTYGRRSAWNVGLIHWLDSNTRVKLFQQMNAEAQNEVDNDVTRIEFITTF